MSVAALLYYILLDFNLRLKKKVSRDRIRQSELGRKSVGNGMLCSDDIRPSITRPRDTSPLPERPLRYESGQNGPVTFYQYWGGSELYWVVVAIVTYFFYSNEISKSSAISCT